jgi:phosphoribosylaminoimidazolecarboxamide formyltransferase/IMP cyclohydrolase
MAYTSATHTIKRALISVSDKTNIVDFARELGSRSIEIISTGGTAKLLQEAGISVTKVSDITDFPEVMDGRVKTLHPKVHGGLLAVLDNESHRAQMKEHEIQSIDIVVINLYPFEETLRKEGASHEDIVENIDIGGPAMLRAAAKNYRWTAVLTSPDQYKSVLQEMDENQNCLTEETRMQLARETFAHTAHYDALIGNYFAKTTSLPTTESSQLLIGTRREQALRYGENPHQNAALFGSFLSVFQQLHGKELSYNNIVDIDSAARLILEFPGKPAVAILKHTNPCGMATADTLAEAYRKAFASDTKSPFGGIIICNQACTIDFAQAVDEIFTEVVIAPSFGEDALAFLRKKKNRRLMKVDMESLKSSLQFDVRSVVSGFLVQSIDNQLLQDTEMRVVTKRQPTDDEVASMMFALKTAKHVKSNAIVYALKDRVLAVGAGQMSRVDSAMIAAKKAQEAGLDLNGSAVASEAFFPFADGLLATVQSGATAVIQPGGSIRDEEVIAAADEHDVAMIFTGMRHFKH